MTLNISTRKTIIIIMIFLIAVAAYLSNLYYPLRSYLIMYPVSKYHQYTGLFRDIPLHIPSGSLAGHKDFFPYVLYFNANQGFARYLGLNQDLQLSIIYNFGDFRF